MAAVSTAPQSLLSRCPVVPVIVLDDPVQALPLGKALLAGGITIAEITLRTSAGIESIRILSDLPDLHVGAGSVLLAGQVDQVVRAGARFVVSPGLSTAVVRRSHELKVPALPGVATSSELMAALELGLNEVKFFPAGVLGGPAAIKALTPPFPTMSFMPSGGVNPDNIGDYLALPAVPAISGSWMVDPELIRSQNWGEISRLSAQAIASAI